MTEDQEGKVAVRRKTTARPLGGATGPRQAGDRRVRSSQAGQAMEPPPVIAPMAKPQRATGAVKTIGGGAVRGGTVYAPATATGPKPRSYRTSKAVDAALIESEMAGAAAGAAADKAPAGAAPEAKPGAESGLAQISAAGVTATGIVATTKNAKGVRRIKLQLRYVSPLSVAKIAFFISLALGVALVVMVWVLWHALDDKTVFAEINSMIIDLAGAPKARELDLLSYVELNRVMSGAMMIAAIDVVIWTLLATIGALIYNLLSALIGGVHVTLQEK